MWNQPQFMQPPNPYGGYVFVPVQGPTSQANGFQPPSIPPKIKRKSIRKQLREAEETRKAVEEHIEWLKKVNKGDEKKDDKKDDKKGGSLGLFHQSMLLMLSVPFLMFVELYLFKQMVKPS